MSGFTKLVPEIVLSSIWNESPEVRCVWITMLATKDESGNVRGNPQSLARLANVHIDAVMEALGKFQAPDPHSNTPENDGRRIEAIPGGWHVVNHDRYRAKDYREHEAERKQEYRRKKEMSGTCPGQVPDSSASVSVSDSGILSFDVGKGMQGETKPDPFDTFWQAYPRKVGKDAARKAWKARAKSLPPIEELVAIIERHKAGPGWKRDGGQFIPHPATWLNQGRWQDEADPHSAPSSVNLLPGATAHVVPTSSGALEISEEQVADWKAKFPRCNVGATIDPECIAVLAPSPMTPERTIRFIVEKLIYWHNKG